jgi:hypothetical protein
VLDVSKAKITAGQDARRKMVTRGTMADCSSTIFSPGNSNNNGIASFNQFDILSYVIVKLSPHT